MPRSFFLRTGHAGGLIVATLLAAACATRSPAPVVDRSERLPSSPAFVPAPAPVAVAVAVPAQARSAPASSATSAAPAAATLPRNAAERPLHHTVKRGETLQGIALEYGQDYRDLVSWNSLDNPNFIRVDQILRVAAPDQVGAPAVTQAMPITSGSIEQRSLDPRGVPAATAVAGNVPLKTGPIGEKRPWSEAALAELSKGDAPATRPAVPAAASSASAPASPAVDADVAWIWPAAGRTIEGFSETRNKGIDIAGKAGDAVLAAGDGRVVYVGNGLRGYGNLVIIKHNDDFLSAYAHNRAVLVKEEQAIRKGQKIAEMGNSDADQVKLHFEIRRQGKPVDPLKYLPGRG